MRTPFVVIGLLIAALIPIGLVTDRSEGTEQTPVATIARRVETLRGLRYTTLPKPQRVSPRQAAADGLKDLDRRYPPAARHADETLYAMLGLLPKGTDLREVSGSVFGQQVAGYYDPLSKRLKVVDGVGTSNRVLDEMVIAHELDHALEDQAIGLDQRKAERGDDAGLAYTALLEGSATQVMYAYVGTYFRSDYAMGGLLGGSLSGTGGTDGIPPFILQQLLFPYTTGQQFAKALLDRAGGKWTLLDLAERTRPPETTEQVMHPEKWVEQEGPLPVTLPARPGWTVRTSGTFGEWQTGQLLARAGHLGDAAGWGGDHYALYEKDGRDALVMRWRFDTPEALRTFAAALRDVPLTGAHEVSVRGGEVTLSISTA